LRDRMDVTPKKGDTRCGPPPLCYATASIKQELQIEKHLTKLILKITKRTEAVMCKVPQK
ncbi:hypothetical protein J6590_107433, partial [Homalodisca vitripennis]